MIRVRDYVDWWGISRLLRKKKRMRTGGIDELVNKQKRQDVSENKTKADVAKRSRKIEMEDGRSKRGAKRRQRPRYEKIG